ncbi:MAG TPA: TIGR03435 family protein [Bryobacteraceae bacterium]
MRVAVLWHSACAATALLVSGIAFGQPAKKPEFEVASIKPGMDRDELQRRARTGELRTGERINGSRAEYIYMTLCQLIASAYEVRTGQVAGPPELLDGEHFDTVGKMPVGSHREEAPLMLQSLLAERFRLAAHRETREQDVKALVVGKDGIKYGVNLRELPSEAPLNAGGTKEDSPEGSGHAVPRMKPGSRFQQMGTVGVTAMPGPDASSIRLEYSGATMADLAYYLGMMAIAGGRKVVDMTGLRGHYDMFLDIPLAELTGAVVIKTDVPDAIGPEPRPGEAASDPGIAPTLQQSLKRLGLELRNQRAPVEHVIVEHVEKMPTEN